ncbi:MAG: hypothetical protein KC620_12545 [Myxococcales bacterium]|nr:hypothetical protein [Myxococcales bacterium]
MKPEELPPIIGLEVVGRGVYLRPRQAYSLRKVLFPRADYRVYASRETNCDWGVPAGYAVNDSPPMPGKQALNQIIIEESFGRFEKRMSVDASLTVGTGPVSVDVNASQTSQLRSEEEAYYAVRSSFVPLWTVYLPDTTSLSPADFDLDIPTPFSHAHRRTYEKFFDRFGTHYVRRAWVGGKATLAFTVSKSSGVSKAEIQAGLKSSYGGSANSNVEQSREKLLSNSSCTVLGKGGDELALAALSSLDEAKYNAWLETVKQNPQVIEIEVQGIWTLIDDAEKARALMEAYKEAYTFSSVSAVVNLEREIYFLRDDDFFTYHLDEDRSSAVRPLAEMWPSLAAAEFTRIDAAFGGKGMVSPDGEDLRNKLYFFRRHRFVRFDVSTGKVDPGYPKTIAEGWPGVPFERIDAALSMGPDSVYLFYGQQYVRFSLKLGRVEEGYPASVAKRWLGLNYDRIDAAIYWGNAKVYFFIEDQYVRYDMVNFRADPGYPKYLVGRYVEDWKFFD